MSTAIQKRSRGVSVKRPSRSSAAANATECTSRSRPPSKVSPTSEKSRARSSSERTSHAVTRGLETESASSRTFFSSRSPWNVNAREAPSSASRRAIAHAIERRLATPSTSPVLPSKRMAARSYETRAAATLGPDFGGFHFPIFRLPSCHFAAPRRSSDRRRGARIGRSSLGGPATRPARLRRTARPARPHRRAADPARAAQWTHPRDRPARAAAAGRVAGRPPAPERHRAGAAERAERVVAGLPPPAGLGTARRDPRAEARDPRREGGPPLRHPPERDHRRPAGLAASGARPQLLRDARLPERALLARDEPEPVGDRRRRDERGDRRARRRDQDRRRRRRRRPAERVLQPRRLLAPGRLPTRRHALDDAEGDRRAHLPRPRLGAAGPARARSAGVLPRHARGRDRGRRRADDRAGGRRPPPDDPALPPRAARAGRPLPGLHRAD